MPSFSPGLDVHVSGTVSLQWLVIGSHDFANCAAPCHIAKGKLRALTGI